MNLSLVADLFARKVFYELKRLRALAKYPFYRKKLIERLSRQIPQLSFETTNICNANCVFCAYQYQSRPTGVMQMALFKKVVDEYVACGGGPIGLTPTVGDPLIDPLLLDRIRYARSQPNITSIGMYTNMILLEKITGEALVESGITKVIVSTSGMDEEMYKRVYRSQAYKKVLSNIHHFIDANEKRGNPVDFRIAMRIDRPMAEVFSGEDCRKIIARIGSDRISVAFTFDNWAGKITQDQLPGTMRLRSSRDFGHPRISACSELYSGPMIYWDGKVGACGCRDVDARELVIGDANKESIVEIWFGEQIQRLREEFMTPKIHKICDTCSLYNNLSVYL